MKGFGTEEYDKTRDCLTLKMGYVFKQRNLNSGMFFMIVQIEHKILKSVCKFIIC